jgi:hypothetical protein
MVFRVVAERNSEKEIPKRILKKISKNPKKRRFILIIAPANINNNISKHKNETISKNSEYKTIEIILERIIVFLEGGEEYKIIALLLEKSPEIKSLAIIIVVNRYIKIEIGKKLFQKIISSTIV